MLCSLTALLRMRERTNWRVLELLDRDRFRQVRGLVDVASATNRDVIRQKLQRNDFQNRRKQFRRTAERKPRGRPIP